MARRRKDTKSRESVDGTKCGAVGCKQQMYGWTPGWVRLMDKRWICPECYEKQLHYVPEDCPFLEAAE